MESEETKALKDEMKGLIRRIELLEARLFGRVEMTSTHLTFWVDGKAVHIPCTDDSIRFVRSACDLVGLGE